MKISNETKVGIIAIVSITMLILGFNFLKGKNLLGSKMTIYARYNNVQGLATSNPVMINGLQVGKINSISNDMDMRSILVEMELNQKINIPDNSVALIIPNPLGDSKVEIKFGESTTYLKKNDTILTSAKKGLIDDVMQKVDPLLFEVKNAVSALDTLLENANTIFDPRTKNNISQSVENLHKLTNSLLVSGNSLENMLDNHNGSIAKTMNNLESITGNFAKNNSKINDLIDKLNKTSNNVSELNLQEIFNSLKIILADLQISLAKLNGKDGSIGMLMNDQSLYKNLTSTGNKLNLLLDDIRMHPKRYVSISVIGKSKKQQPLNVPLPDTLNSPYLKQP